MRKTLVAAAFLSAIASSAAADPETEERARFCTVCHRPGYSVSYVPTLDGQTYEYLVNQLKAFKEKRRPSDGHQRYWGERSEKDVQAMAAYFAARARIRERFELDAGKVALGQSRAQALMCATCHQPDYSGRETAARLAGLQPQYAAAQIAAFASGQRPHPRIDRASGLSREDAEALAQYFAQIP
ncbi:MAG TPA: hypothetical protein VJU81_17535 [Methylomirabilota bacterium]|nr:hypothetical protein [Methylomirabilota bacterium]